MELHKVIVVIHQQILGKKIRLRKEDVYKSKKQIHIQLSMIAKLFTVYRKIQNIKQSS